MSYARYSLRLLCLLVAAECFVGSSERWKKREINQIVEIDIQNEGDKYFQKKLDIGGKHKLFINRNSPKINPEEVSKLEVKQHSIFERRNKAGIDQTINNRFVLSPKENIEAHRNITQLKPHINLVANRTKAIERPKAIHVDRTIFKFVNNRVNMSSKANTKQMKPIIHTFNKLNLTNHLSVNKSVKFPLMVNAKTNATKMSTKLKKLANLFENVKKLNQSHLNVKHIAGLLKNLLNKTIITNHPHTQVNIFKSNRFTKNSSISIHPPQNLTSFQKVLKANVKPLKIIPKVVSVTDNNNNNNYINNNNNNNKNNNKGRNNKNNTNLAASKHLQRTHNNLTSNTIVNKTKTATHLKSEKRTPQEMVEALSNNENAKNHTVVLNSSVPVHTEIPHDEKSESTQEAHPGTPQNTETENAHDVHTEPPHDEQTTTEAQNNEHNIEHNDIHPTISAIANNTVSSQEHTPPVQAENKTLTDTTEQPAHLQGPSEHANTQTNSSSTDVTGGTSNTQVSANTGSNEQGDGHTNNIETTSNEGITPSNSSTVHMAPEVHVNEQNTHTEDVVQASTGIVNQEVSAEIVNKTATENVNTFTNQTATDANTNNTPAIGVEQNTNLANISSTFSGPVNGTTTHEETASESNNSESNHNAVETTNANSNTHTEQTNSEQNQQQTNHALASELKDELEQLSNSLNMSSDESNTSHDQTSPTITVLSAPLSLENATQLENGNKLLIFEKGNLDKTGTFHVLNITDYKIPQETIPKAEPSVTVANVNMTTENFTNIIDNMNNTETNDGNNTTESNNNNTNIEQNNTNKTEEILPKVSSNEISPPGATEDTKQTNVSDVVSFKASQGDVSNNNNTLNTTEIEGINLTNSSDTLNVTEQKIENFNNDTNPLNLTDNQLLGNALTNLEPNNTVSSLNETLSDNNGNNTDIGVTNPLSINDTQNNNSTNNNNSTLNILENSGNKNTTNEDSITNLPSLASLPQQNATNITTSSIKYKKLPSGRNKTLVSPDKIKLKAKQAVESALKELLKVDDSLSNSHEIVLKPSKEIKITLSKVNASNSTVKTGKFKKDVGRKDVRVDNKKNETSINFNKLKEKVELKLDDKGAHNSEKQNDIVTQAENSTNAQNNTLKEKSIEKDKKLDIKDETKDVKEEGLAPAPIDTPQTKPDKPKHGKNGKCTKDCPYAKANNQDKTKTVEGLNTCHCCQCKNHSKEVIELGNPTPTSKALFEIESKLSSERQLGFPTARPTTRPTVVNYKKLLEPQCKNGICDVEGFCKDKKTGTYPNHNDCRKYWICVGGRTYPAICPEGLVFNYKIFQCDDRIDIPMVLEEWYWATCNTKKSGIVKFKKKTYKLKKSRRRNFIG